MSYEYRQSILAFLKKKSHIAKLLTEHLDPSIDGDLKS